MTSSPPDPARTALWAERLAARVAPDEVDLALDVVEAYAAGGSRRREAFDRPRADPGAFGAGAAMFLPAVLDALSVSYVAVKQFLGDPAVNSMIATASLAVALRSARRGTRPGEPGPAVDTTATPVPADSGRPDEVADPDVVTSATTAFVAVRTRLESAGATPESADGAAAGALEVLAEDPSGATGFVDDIASQPGR